MENTTKEVKEEVKPEELTQEDFKVIYNILVTAPIQVTLNDINNLNAVGKISEKIKNILTLVNKA